MGLRKTKVRPELLTKVNAREAVEREQRRCVATDGVFWRYRPDWQPPAPAERRLCKRKSVPLWKPDRGTQLLVTCLDLHFKLGMFEPFFCSLAVYDLKDRCRLTENFYFDLNPTAVLSGVLEVQRSMADAITRSRHCIFSITDRCDAVYLVLRVQRVLQGSADDLDMYVRDKAPRTAAELAAMAKRANPTISRLSDFRQSVAWGMVSLFDSDGSFQHDGVDRLPAGARVDMNRLYIQRETLREADFIALMASVVKDPARGPRPCPDPGSFFRFGLVELDDKFQPANRIDPSCISLKNTASVVPLAPSSLPRETGAGAVVKEAQNFVLEEILPNSSFVNLLYVYPEFIRFQKFRNLACRVQIRAGDAKLEQVRERCLEQEQEGGRLTEADEQQPQEQQQERQPQRTVLIAAVYRRALSLTHAHGTHPPSATIATTTTTTTHNHTHTSHHPNRRHPPS